MTTLNTQALARQNRPRNDGIVAAGVGLDEELRQLPEDHLPRASEMAHRQRQKRLLHKVVLQ